MSKKLRDICFYGKEKVETSNIDLNNYVSTENMLPNKSGIVPSEKLPNLALTPAFFKGDILVSNIRPYFKKIWYASSNGGCSNDVLVFRAKANIDSSYLYYLLADDNFFTYAMASAKGTKMPRGDKSAIMEYVIPEHGILIQQKIAKILSSIDRKIYFNNKINNNLEQQVLSLYKNTILIDIDKSGTIGDYCCVKSGFAFKSSWWTKKGLKVIKIKNIDNDKINLTDCSYVSNDKLQYATDFIANGGDLLIAMTGATIGKFAIVPKTKQTLLINQRVGKFFLGDNPIDKLPYLYCTLKQPDIYNEIVNRGQGSAQPNISSNDIMTISCVYPNIDIIDEFNSMCKPYFQTMINNMYENEQLTYLRDTLLPKLMSGEINVENVDISTDKLYEPANKSKLSAEPYNSSGSFASASKNLPSEQSSSADKLSFSIMIIEYFYIKIVIIIGVVNYKNNTFKWSNNPV